MIYIIVINLFLQLMHLTFRKEVAQRKKVLFRILFPTLFFSSSMRSRSAFDAMGIPHISSAFSPLRTVNPSFSTP